MANNKKQPKDKFPDNMPTGLNMTWWYMDDVETLIASMQLKLDYTQQRLEKAEAEISQLKEEKNSAKHELNDLFKQFKKLRKNTESKIHYLEDYLNSKLEEIKIKHISDN